MSEIARRLPRSRLDLVEIALYIGRDNPTAADEFLREVERQIQQLAQMPGMGARCGFRSKPLSGLRKWCIPRYRNYIIYYRPVEGGIEVVRLLHGARDQQKALKSGL